MTKTKKPEALPSNMALDKDKQKEFNQSVKERNQKASADFGTGNPGVCYIGHIPRGFHEEAMKGYFSQFGKVNKLRVARSKKTGSPKGYAFVEFENDGVAQLVAETMDNYLMFHKLLKCQYLPVTKVHPKTFKGANRAFKKPTSHIRARLRHDAPKTEEKMEESKRKQLKKAQKKLATLAAMGIAFRYPGLVPPEKIEEVVEEETKDPADYLAEEAIEMLGSSSEEQEEEQPKAKRARILARTSKRKNSSSEKAPLTKKAKRDESPAVASSPSEPKTLWSRKSPRVVETMITPKVLEAAGVKIPISPMVPVPLKKTPKSKKDADQKTPKSTGKSAVEKKTPKSATPAVEKKTPKSATPAVEKKTPKSATPAVEKKTPKSATPAEKKTPKSATPAVEKKTPKSATPAVEKKTPKSATPAVEKKTPNSVKSTPTTVSKKTPQKTVEKSAEKAKKAKK